MTTQEIDQQRSERAADTPASGTQTQANVGRMETIISRDGTRIAYRRSGEGPPLVLMHGTAANHGRWSPVLPTLEEYFAIYAIDRRGRGGSGDGHGYAVHREFEDVAAVIDSIGEPVNLLGHSYGALLALEAALLTGNIRQLVLYDPGIEAGEEIYPHEVIERLEALLEAGDRDGVVATTMREVAGLPPETVEHLRTLPVWQTRVAAAHTIPRELRAVKAYRFDPDRFRDLGVPPTLLLSGGSSPAALKKAVETVNGALPDSRIVVMPGQGHAAMDTGTDLFTAEVLRFLTADAQQVPTPSKG